MLKEELEVMRHDVTPAQFLSYVRRMIKSHGITCVCPDDITLRYFADPRETLRVDYHDVPGAPCKAEHFHARPYDMQCYLKNYAGTVFNHIMEFTFDDEKTGWGYCYILNTWNEEENSSAK